MKSFGKGGIRSFPKRMSPNISKVKNNVVESRGNLKDIKELPDLKDRELKTDYLLRAKLEEPREPTDFLLVNETDLFLINFEDKILI